jgi:hypothetical protein
MWHQRIFVGLRVPGIAELGVFCDQYCTGSVFATLLKKYCRCPGARLVPYAWCSPTYVLWVFARSCDGTLVQGLFSAYGGNEIALIT